MALLVFSASASALELKYVGHFEIPSLQKFSDSTIGALSGLISADEGKTFWAVSGDHGKMGRPRIYQFALELRLRNKKQPFRLKPIKMVELSVNESESAHQSTHSSPKIFSPVIDLEAISLLPWGDFLLANTGDLTTKPLALPQILDIKNDGGIVREFSLPPAFLPTSDPQQKRGLQGHLTLGGLAAVPDGKTWILAAEGALAQDGSGFRRLVAYHSPAAWKLAPKEQYAYPIETRNSGKIDFPRGIADLVFLNSTVFLSVERVMVVTAAGPQFEVEIFQCDLAGATDISSLTQLDISSAATIKPISKKLILRLAHWRKKIGKIENFEGIALGPTLSNGQKTVLLVSDDNFMRNLRTQFLLLSIKE
jgi:hypothetical protein